mmetsp:Transcript_37975/g.79527  ORF Transcript_37975/g.79527 Transcript_37975/m.79527 type:complete len:208 (-) Transcript_37975:333-956(-)
MRPLTKRTQPGRPHRWSTIRWSLKRTSTISSAFTESSLTPGPAMTIGGSSPTASLVSICRTSRRPRTSRQLCTLSRSLWKTPTTPPSCSGTSATSTGTTRSCASTAPPWTSPPAASTCWSSRSRAIGAPPSTGSTRSSRCRSKPWTSTTRSRRWPMPSSARTRRTAASSSRSGSPRSRSSSGSRASCCSGSATRPRSRRPRPAQASA